MIEAVPAAVAMLRTNVARLGAQHVQIIEATATDYLAGPAQGFDIVFIDPPFASELIARTSELLETGGWLSPGALVYVEAPAKLRPLPVPEAWECIRSGTAGQVGYHLLSTRR